MDGEKVLALHQLRLASGGHHGGPLFAREPFALGGRHGNRHVNEDAVLQADDHVGLAGHGGVDGIARKGIAQHGVDRWRVRCECNSWDRSSG